MSLRWTFRIAVAIVLNLVFFILQAYASERPFTIDEIKNATCYIPTCSGRTPCSEVKLKDGAYCIAFKNANGSFRGDKESGVIDKISLGTYKGKPAAVARQTGSSGHWAAILLFTRLANGKIDTYYNLGGMPPYLTNLKIVNDQVICDVKDVPVNPAIDDCCEEEHEKGPAVDTLRTSNGPLAIADVANSTCWLPDEVGIDHKVKLVNGQYAGKFGYIKLKEVALGNFDNTNWAIARAICKLKQDEAKSIWYVYKQLGPKIRYLEYFYDEIGTPADSVCNIRLEGKKNIGGNPIYALYDIKGIKLKSADFENKK